MKSGPYRRVWDCLIVLWIIRSGAQAEAEAVLADYRAGR